MELLEISIYSYSVANTDFSEQDQQGINEITFQSLLNCINNPKSLFNAVVQFSLTVNLSYRKSRCTELVSTGSQIICSARNVKLDRYFSEIIESYSHDYKSIIPPLRSFAPSRQNRVENSIQEDKVLFHYSNGASIFLFHPLPEIQTVLTASCSQHQLILRISPDFLYYLSFACYSV